MVHIADDAGIKYIKGFCFFVFQVHHKLLGHVFIASINATEDGQIGVMGFLPTAVRDPQFWRSSAMLT